MPTGPTNATSLDAPRTADYDAANAPSVESFPRARNRQHPTVPSPSGYTLPRTKIAAGNYGVDAGDVGPGNPFYVESVQERRLAESQMLSAMNAAAFDGARGRSAGRVSTCDRRGSVGNRGTIR